MLVCLFVFIFFCSHEQNRHRCTVFADLLTIICVLSWPLLRGPEVRRLVGTKTDVRDARSHHPRAPNTETVLGLVDLISSESSKSVSISYLFAIRLNVLGTLSLTLELLV